MNVLIGLGNPFRRDDGVGHIVAEAARARVGDDVTVVELDGDPARMIEAWDGAELAVVVDAVASGSAPGTLHRVEDTADLPPGTSNPSSHGLGVTEAVALGRALGRCPDRLVVHGVEVDDTGDGEGLSDVVAAAVPALVDRVVAELEN